MDKKQLKELLSQFSKEEILDLISDTESKPTNKKRRRGKGGRKRISPSLNLLINLTR